MPMKAGDRVWVKLGRRYHSGVVAQVMDARLGVYRVEFPDGSTVTGTDKDILPIGDYTPIHGEPVTPVGPIGESGL